MICISFNIYSKKDGLNIVKVIFRDVIGCSIRVYKFTFLKIHKGPPKMLNRNRCCMRSATLLKKRLWHRCFAVNFVKFPRTFLHRAPLVATSALRFFFILNEKYRRNDRVTISHALPKVTMALFLVNLVWTLSLYTKPLTR